MNRFSLSPSEPKHDAPASFFHPNTYLDHRFIRRSDTCGHFLDNKLTSPLDLWCCRASLATHKQGNACPQANHTTNHLCHCANAEHPSHTEKLTRIHCCIHYQLANK